VLSGFRDRFNIAVCFAQRCPGANGEAGNRFWPDSDYPDKE
jgi:hypothetical protein